MTAWTQRWPVASLLVSLPLLFTPVFATGAQQSPTSFPLTLRKFCPEEPKCQGTKRSDIISMPDAAPQLAMLQQGFKAEKTLAASDSLAEPAEKRPHALLRQTAAQPAVESSVFTWGVNAESDHPQFIAKWGSHPRVQHYAATPPRLQGMVLNIFAKDSNGQGGLLLVLEVPSPCGLADNWVEVDRSRCSRKYPCALRLPSGAVRHAEGVPSATRFRTRVVLDDEDYLTNFLEYDRVTLDHDAQITVAHSKPSARGSDDPGRPSTSRVLRFNLSPVLASGALSVTPVLEHASADTTVTMRLRQAVPAVSLRQETQATTEAKAQSGMLAQSQLDMIALETALQSYRKEWAAEWRSPSKATSGCDFSVFEVVADQLYPGEMELEVWIESGSASISDVLVTARVSWAEAEVTLLETVMKDHFAFFNDPDVMIHGLPMGFLKPGGVYEHGISISNPAEWGYAMESWVIMAETGALQPQEVVAKLSESFQTLSTLQQDPDQFAHGLFYPYYLLRVNGEKQFPKRTDYKELPCGDVALLYASLMVVQGWLTTNFFSAQATTCAGILQRMSFTHCVSMTNCNGKVAANDPRWSNGAGNSQGDQFWSVPLTFHADTLEKNAHNWNVWADEGGLVAMVVALTGAVNDSQYESIVRQQQRYSPCTHWEGITVGHAAFFNSVFTLPTRSMLGFGTLFSSAYYHEFAVRTVLPSFRAYQKLKKNLGVDYMGPSDAMTMKPKGHPDKIFGSYAYWPPNNMYSCGEGKTLLENQCTWCKGIQYEGLEDPLDLIVPHGNMASFLVSAMMEKSQFTSWLEDTKRLMTDASGVYKPGYGLEVVAPARRTALGATFEGALEGRNIRESLSTGYTILSMYEGLATMSRRYELAKQAGHTVLGSYAPPKYKPLSDFVNALPEVRAKIDHLLVMANQQESKEKRCIPSAYGPAGQY